MKFTIALQNLPFVPQKEQIIFVESNFNEDVNRFIRENYGRICEYCSNRGYAFCYLPMLTAEPIDTDVLLYNVPYADPQKKYEPLGSDYLLQFMANPRNRDLIPPSLLYLTSKVNDTSEVLFDGVSVTDQEDYPTLEDIFFLRLDSIFCEPADDGVRFSIGSKYIDDIFDEESTQLAEDIDDIFDEESTQLAEDIREKIEKLKARGVDTYRLLQYLVKSEPLSPLLITKDFRILLPRYNKEIVMMPLPKALFLLYLKHPEGIPFKHLPDYQEELMEIYAKLRPQADPMAMKKSIADLTDPFGKSINEKCSRIREAFVKEFDDHLACNYYITGQRGEAKRITLPTDLVKWEG